MVKNLLAMQETRVRSLGREGPLEKGMATHSRILAWRIHGQRSLVGYSLWGCKGLDVTERLTLTFKIFGRSWPWVCCIPGRGRTLPSSDESWKRNV